MIRTTAIMGAVIALVLGYHLSRDPMVALLGLAHTGAVSDGAGRILLVDHLSSTDAPIIAQLFQGEVWGRHRAVTWGIWLPMLALTLAFSGLLGNLSRAADRAPMNASRRASLPPVGLGLPLFLGACLGATAPLSPLAALLPWLVCAVGLTVLVGLLQLLPEARERGLIALSGTRWFWLGFLLLSPRGFFYWSPEPSGLLRGPSWTELFLLLGLVASISWVSSSTKAGSTCRWISLSRAELWILLPCLALAMAVGSLQGALLPAYFLSSLASCCLLAWVVDRGPGRRLLGAFLGLALTTLLTCAGGLPRWHPALLSPGSEPELAQAQSHLAREFAGQVRLRRVDGMTLLVGCNLDVARQSDVLMLATRTLGEQPVSITVRTRRWERAARTVLALTVTLFLVIPTVLLTVAPPGRRGRFLRGACVLLAAVNLAFAAGAMMGWFWLDPMPHLAGFGLAYLLAWTTLGHARAWVDAWIAQNVRKRRSVTSVC